MSVTITRMRRRHIEAALAIIRAHDKDDAKAAKTYFARKARSRKRWRATSARHYVALDDNMVVGVCGVDKDVEEGVDVWWLGWFYVDASSRGGGVGKALFDRSVRFARKHGARKLFVDTGSGKSYRRARDFYAGQGAVEEGRLRDFYGAGDHMVIYGLALSGK